jgi:hypothetical protein
MSTVYNRIAGQNLVRAMFHENHVNPVYRPINAKLV